MVGHNVNYKNYTLSELKYAWTIFDIRQQLALHRLGLFYNLHLIYMQVCLWHISKQEMSDCVMWHRECEHELDLQQPCRPGLGLLYRGKGQASRTTRAGGRTPRTPRSGGASRILRGLMFGRVKIFWARADVWRLLLKATTKEKKVARKLSTKVTTTKKRKKVARKLRANCCSSGGGAHVG